MTEETVKELIDGGQEDVKIPVLVIDIETGKSPDMAKYIKPFDDKTDVKYGNAKNEELRENIKRQAYAIYMNQAESVAPLYAQTGQILLISTAYIDNVNETEPIITLDYQKEGYTEKMLLQNFMNTLKRVREKYGFLVGFNLKKFDLPFIIQRCWINGVEPIPMVSKGKYWEDWIVDLYEIWKMGTDWNPNSKFISNSLKSVVEVLGIGTKSDDGKLFQKLFYKDLETSLAYAKNDINITFKLFKRLQKFIIN